MEYKAAQEAKRAENAKAFADEIQAQTSQLENNLQNLGDIAEKKESEITTLQKKHDFIKSLNGRKIKTLEQIEKLPHKLKKGVFSAKEEVVMSKNDYDMLVATALSSPRVTQDALEKSLLKRLEEFEQTLSTASAKMNTVMDLSFVKGFEKIS